VRNALNTDMRNMLVETFRLAALDPSIDAVTLRGAGPDYSAGGDLDEFGSFGDPASAHLVRLASSVGHSLAAVADIVTAELHGACFGSGIEIPAFAGRVVADQSARFALPELGLGLVPGAGGTWSLPQRIGRYRTALLALTCEPIGVEVALDWGLVDGVLPAG
jgi:enoyl-CoA hydratase/carnithine racemase